MSHKHIIHKKQLSELLPTITDLPWVLSSTSDTLLLPVSNIPDENTFKALNALPCGTHTNDYKSGRGVMEIAFPQKKDALMQTLWDTLFEQAYTERERRLDHLQTLGWDYRYTGMRDGFFLWADQLDEETQSMLYFHNENSDRLKPQPYLGKGSLLVKKYLRESTDDYPLRISIEEGMFSEESNALRDRVHKHVMKEAASLANSLSALPWSMDRNGAFHLPASVAAGIEEAPQADGLPVKYNELPRIFERFHINREGESYVFKPPHKQDIIPYKIYATLKEQALQQATAAMDKEWRYDEETHEFYVDKELPEIAEQETNGLIVKNNRVALSGSLAQFRWNAKETRDFKDKVKKFKQKLYDLVPEQDIGDLGKKDWKYSKSDGSYSISSDQLEADDIAIIKSYGIEEHSYHSDSAAAKAMGFDVSFDDLPNKYIVKSDVAEHIGLFANIDRAMQKRSQAYLANNLEAVESLPWKFEYRDHAEAYPFTVELDSRELEGEAAQTVEQLERHNLLNTHYKSIGSTEVSSPLLLRALKQKHTEFIENETNALLALPWQISYHGIFVEAKDLDAESLKHMEEIGFESEREKFDIGSDLTPNTGYYTAKVFDELRQKITAKIQRETDYPEIFSKIQNLNWQVDLSGDLELQTTNDKLAEELKAQLPHAKYGFHQDFGLDITSSAEARKEEKHHFEILDPAAHPENMYAKLHAPLFEALIGKARERNQPSMARIANFPWKKEGETISVARHELSADQNQLIEQLPWHYRQETTPDDRIPSKVMYTLDPNARDKALYDAVSKKLTIAEGVTGPG